MSLTLLIGNPRNYTGCPGMPRTSYGREMKHNKTINFHIGNADHNPFTFECNIIVFKTSLFFNTLIPLAIKR